VGQLKVEKFVPNDKLKSWDIALKVFKVGHLKIDKSAPNAKLQSW
jgi:hypothetical protein